MIEKHLEDIGRFVSEQTGKAVETAVTRAADEALALTTTVEEKVTELDERLESTTEATKALVTQAASEAAASAEQRLQKAVAALQEDLAQASVQHQYLLDELSAKTLSLHEATEEKAATQHQEEMVALAEQLKSQEVFQAQLTQRLAEIKDGEKGDQGEQGNDGADGMDRPLLEPVELDPTRSYLKNTLGTHNNGLWIATKEAQGDPETDPHAWHCILDAMTTLSVDFAEDHQFSLTVKTATGQRIEDTFSIPFPTHEGIWEEGKTYQRGQWVTKGSSVWKALEDTDGCPPGNGWQQIIKAPRGAKGDKGESITGPQGKPGRNGRDAELPPGFLEEVKSLAGERKAFEDGRSGAYAITSFRGYFQPGERYSSGDVVDQLGSMYICTSGGSWEKFVDAAPSFELFVHVPPQASTPPSPWRGQWKSGSTYNTGQMVRDGQWLMAANKQTSERAAPQAIGDEFQGYNGGDPTTSDLAKQIIFGTQYFAQQGAWINGYRVYTVAGNAYRTFSVNSDGEVTELHTFTAAATGWTEYRLAPIPVWAGTILQVLAVVQEPAGTPTTFVGDWDYDTPNNPSTPDPGEIIHANNEASVLRIHKTDNNGGDRTAELEALTVGDVIDSGDLRYAIQTVGNNGTWMAFSVSPAVQVSPDGVREFTFETVSPTPITYLADQDYYLATNMKGLLGVDLPYEDIPLDDSAYGIDLLVQSAIISADWDLMAFSSEISPTSAEAVAAVGWREELENLGSGNLPTRISRLESLLGALPDILGEV